MKEWLPSAQYVSGTKEKIRRSPYYLRKCLKLGADIFELNSNSLIVVDYYSKYPELCLLKDKTAGSVITSMKSMFARHGIPDEVVADNMPFSSKSFVSLQGIGVLLSVPRVLVPMEKWDE